MEPDQSCWIASLSGSTNEVYALHDGKRPSGGSVAGDKCIGEQLKKLGQPTPPGLRGRRRRHIGDLIDINEVDHEAVEIEKRQGSCKPYSMLFGRGTTGKNIIHGEDLTNFLLMTECRVWDDG